MNILCYGDSNTWGYVPNINGYSKDAIIQKYDDIDCWWYNLKKDNNVIINGLCGRCIAHENRWLKNRNATTTIIKELNLYKNLDLIIIQLGTNDCKSEYGNTASEIAQNLENLIKIIKTQTNAQIMIISPAIIKEDNKITQRYYIGAQSKSIELDYFYKDIAQKNNLIFVSGQHLEIGEDGEHLTKKGHKLLGSRVLLKVKQLTNYPEMGNKGLVQML